VLSATDLLYRIYLAMRGKRVWHWRYYGPHYHAERTDAGYSVTYRGRRFDFGVPVRSEHVDRPLIILCAGPSVSEILRPERVWGHTALAMNGSHSLYDGNAEVFSYYLVSDIGFIRRQWDSFVRGVAVSRTLLLDHRVIAEVLSRSEAPLRGKEVLCFNNLHRPFGRPLEKPQDRPQAGFFCRDGIVFSINPDLGFNPSKTVAYVALEIGVALGFRDIRFLGLDLGGSGRFYAEKGAEKTMIADDYEGYIEPHFRYASEVCGRLGVVLRNGSPVSRLPNAIIPRTSPEWVLSEPMGPMAPGIAARCE